MMQAKPRPAPYLCSAPSLLCERPHQGFLIDQYNDAQDDQGQNENVENL